MNAMEDRTLSVKYRQWWCTVQFLHETLSRQEEGTHRGGAELEEEGNVDRAEPAKTCETNLRQTE